jgi:hypothetical protein
MCESTKPSLTVKVGDKIRVTNAILNEGYDNGDVFVVKSVFTNGDVVASAEQTVCNVSPAAHVLWGDEFEVVA